jgi:hypothetical protein
MRGGKRSCWTRIGSRIAAQEGSLPGVGHELGRSRAADDKERNHGKNEAIKAKIPTAAARAMRHHLDEIADRYWKVPSEERR